MKTMKLFALCLTMFAFNLCLSQETFVQVDYMKVKPGMSEKYLEIEKAWKGIHQKRIDMGQIQGWYLYEVSPRGTGAKYDYVTVTVYNGWDKLGTANDGWGDLAKKMSANEKEAFENASKTRDLVSSQIFQARDGVFRSPESGKGPAKYNLVNYMKVPADKIGAYVKMETEVFKPVHQEAVNQGKRAGWGMYSKALPYGNSDGYNGITVDFYDTWAQMNEGNGDIFEKIHPDMKSEDVGKMVRENRVLVKGELNVLVDYVEKAPN